MRSVQALVGRNLRIFFRDKMNVVFSLIGSLVLFLLYALFLGNSQVDSIAAQSPTVARSAIALFVNSWMFAGVVFISTVTTGLAALSALVDDAQSGRFKDFLVSPIGKTPLVAGYILAATIIAVIISSATLVFGFFYLWIFNGHLLSFGVIARSCGYVVLCSLAFTSLAAVLVSFVRTSASQSALNTTMGVLTGFIAAAYIPIVAFPRGVANVISALPWAQGGMLLRREFSTETLNAIIPGNELARDQLRADLGLDLSVGNFDISTTFVILVLVCMAVVFTSIAAQRIRRRIA